MEEFEKYEGAIRALGTFVGELYRSANDKSPGLSDYTFTVMDRWFLGRFRDLALDCRHAANPEVCPDVKERFLLLAGRYLTDYVYFVRRVHFYSSGREKDQAQFVFRMTYEFFLTLLSVFYQEFAEEQRMRYRGLSGRIGLSPVDLDLVVGTINDICRDVNLSEESFVIYPGHCI